MPDMNFREGSWMSLGASPRFQQTARRLTREAALRRVLFAVAACVGFTLSPIQTCRAQGVPAVADEPDAEKPILALDTGGHTDAVYKLMVTGYGDQLISVGIDKTIRFWDLGSGEPLRVLRPPIGPGVHGYLFSAALSPDDTLLAVGTYRALTPLYDHRIHLIELPVGRIVRSLKGHSYTIYDLAFSPDGERLASASHDSTVRIWDVKTGESLKTLRGHSEPVHGVAWSADGKQVVSGALDKTARIWSVETGDTTAVLREHQGQIMTVGWSPDGRTVATGCNDRAIRLYEPNGKLRYSWPKLPNEIMSLKFAPDSKRLLYTYGSNAAPPIGAAILDMVRGAQLAHSSGHENSPISCVFAANGRQAVTGDSISRIRVWDSNSGATLRKLDGRGQSMISAGWSADGQAIAWGTHVAGVATDVGGPLERTFCLTNFDFGPPPDKTFVRARPAAGGLKMGFNLDEAPVNMRKVVFTQNGTQFSSFTIPQPYDQVRCYTLLPDGRAVIGTQCGAYLINVKSGMIEREMSDRGEGLWGLAPSPDSRYVLTAGNDQVLRVWNLEKGELLVAFFVADEEWIAWTPGGYYAASLAGESLMGWHINRGPESLADFHPAARFHKSLYRPDVIRRLLPTGDLTRAIEQADRERKNESRVVRVDDVLPAEVKISQPASTRVEQTDSKLTIRATAEAKGGHPLEALQLMIDGRPVGPARQVAPDPAGQKPGLVEEEWTLDLPPGEYRVVVKAESDKSYALSQPIEVARPAGKDAPRPRLFILSVGGSPDANSAASIAKALSAAAPGLFGEVITSVLEGEQATPAAVNAELEKIRGQASLADTTLVYYAGRETLDTAGHYRLSAARGSSQDRAGVWLSDHELKRGLAAIPGRVLMAVDTTRSEQHASRESSTGWCGSTAAEEANRLDVAASDFLRELLTEEYGIVVLRASRRASAAKSNAGASPFAQAFVEAVGGKAERDRNGVIYLHELAKYINQRVRELSGGKENSVIERPVNVRSFPIAKPELSAPAK
jgi:WD40 repeat protein